jgi:hypothetical protein
MKYVCGPNKTEVEINLPEGTKKNILFAISGGADSAILLYILAKMDKEAKTEHNFTLFTVPRPDGGANYSPGIAKWVSEKLQINLPEPMIIGDGNLPHQIVVKVVNKQLLDTNKYDLLYIAENKIPPTDIGGLAPIRAPKAHYERKSLPFWGVTKECTLDLYYQENVTELLQLTHSCTERVVGRCNVCFQCKERAWAFSQLGLADPGSA